MRSIQLGWDDFPRLPAGTALHDYLGACRLRTVVMEPDARTVTVVLHDREGLPWRFTFSGVEICCDASRDAADEVPGDLGIWELEASPPFPRDGRQVRLFMLDGNTNLSIYASSVTVTHTG